MKSVLSRAGLEVRRKPTTPPYPPDFDYDLVALCERVAPYTMTSPERILALRDAVRQVVVHDVSGAVVESGVWRGGSMMVVAATLHELGVDDRDLYLFDTFSHLPEPTEVDVDLWGTSAADIREAIPANGGHRYLTMAEVHRLVGSTGYPMDRIHLVQGLVEETIPQEAPDQIALCRLDTGFYESTSHEMRHLYPRIAPGGVLVIDDYGHFLGARKAVDEYFETAGINTMLHRIDYTGRLVVKAPAGPSVRSGSV